MRTTIEINAAKCLECNTIIRSSHVHDFRTCVCGNVSVDGGTEYIRRCYRDYDKIHDIGTLAEYESLLAEQPTR